MADFLDALRSQTLLADGAMGSYLFELTGRLSETNHVYEAFNVDQPDLVEKVHAAYLAAGARCLKTNTFAANRLQLRTLGQEARISQLNRAGLERARHAIATFQSQQSAPADCFVLGSLGPTPEAIIDPTEVAACYQEQLEALAGADAILLETFHSLTQLLAVIALIRSLPGMPPVIAEMQLTTHADGTLDPDPADYLEQMAKLQVAAAGVNCCAPWDASAFVDAVKDLPVLRDGRVALVAMPNAGGFQRIGNRFMTAVNPEYAGKMARDFASRGVHLLGGCCEMHPAHIREMHHYLQSRQSRVQMLAAATDGPPANSAGTAEKRGNGRLSRKLKDGQFVVSIEALPPRGTDPEILRRKIDLLGAFAASGLIDAIDLTDGSRGIPLMPPSDFIQLIRERLGWDGASGDLIELIPHFTSRDLNVMGIQSRLMGYYGQRIHNVLFVTGDPPKMSPTYPRSTAVFDLDSIGMIQLTHSCLNAGMDFGGVPLGKHADPRTHFTIGAGAEPEARDLPRELDRLARKIDAGADYIMTQPAFRHAPLATLEPLRDRCAFLIGVMVLTSLDHARRMAHVPGVTVPDEVLDRMAALSDPADQLKVGQEIAAEQIRWLVRDGWPGVYLMSSASGMGTLDILRAGLT